MTHSELPFHAMSSTNALKRDVKAVVQLAWPLIISNLFFTAQILIDRLLLSWFDSDCMAAAGAASMLGMTLVQLLQHTALFAITFVAQYVGANRKHEVGAMVNQAIIFAVLGGTLYMLLIPMAGTFIRCIGHDERLLAHETAYLECIGFAAMPIAITAAISSFFAGRGDTRTIIWIQIVGTMVNGSLDYLLIFGHLGFPQWGIRGAGWATVAGCWASTFIALLLYLRPRYFEEYHVHRVWHLDRHRMVRLLKFGVPNGLLATLDMTVWTLFTVFIGWLGPSQLAATMLVFNVNAAFLIPMLGIGQAVSVLVGQRLGANQPMFAEHAAWIGIGIAECFMTTAAIGLACFPAFCLWLFQPYVIDSRWLEVEQWVPSLLIFMALYTFFDCLCITLGYALRGAGDTRFVSTAAAVIGGVFLVLPVFLICRYHSDFYWAWTAVIVYLMAQAAIFLARFIWGPWRTMRVIEPLPSRNGELTIEPEKTTSTCTSAMTGDNLS